MYPDLYLDHFRNPRGHGSLPEPTHSGSAVDPVCGDELTLDLSVAGGKIVEARFRVRGCSGAIAVGSVLTTLLPDRAAGPECVTREEIEEALGGVPRGMRHASRLGVNTVASALASRSRSALDPSPGAE